MRSLHVTLALACVSIISTSKASLSGGNPCTRDSTDDSESAIERNGNISPPYDTSFTIEPITPSMQLGEGPYWCHETRQLYFVDIPQGKVHKLNTKSGQLSTYNACHGTASYVIGVQRTTDHFIVGCGRNMTLIQLDHNLDKLKPNMQTLTSVDVDRSDTRFNDAKIDTVGRFWGGTMGPEINSKVTLNRGSLYTIDSKLKITKKLSPVSISNGLAWNRDDTKMYYIDSPTKQIISFDYDLVHGDVKNPQVAFDFNAHNLTGVPDGMTIDTDDNLWVAHHNGGSVLHVDPREGKLLRTIHIPATRVTSVTFGDGFLDTLFVTTARQENAQANSKEPDAGRVFAVKGLGVRGLIPNKFKLEL